MFVYKIINIMLFCISWFILGFCIICLFLICLLIHDLFMVNLPFHDVISERVHSLCINSQSLISNIILDLNGTPWTCLLGTWCIMIYDYWVLKDLHPRETAKRWVWRQRLVRSAIYMPQYGEIEQIYKFTFFKIKFHL